jgi:hypothetical protein
MTGYEQQLLTRAEMLEDTGDLIQVITAILAGAQGAGVDPAAVTSLAAAARALDPAGGAPAYRAGSRTGRHPGSGYWSDGKFLEAVSDAEDQICDWLRDADQLADQVIAAADQAHDDLARAQRDLQAARADLAAAYAMPTRDPCTGCHPAKAAAIAAAEAAVVDAEERIRAAGRRIRRCEDTSEILDPPTRRLRAALQALRQVPHDLGEVYELVYEFIRKGGKLPVYARWIEGKGAHT